MPLNRARDAGAEFQYTVLVSESRSDMDWYYLDGAKRLGPFSGEQFQNLVTAGAIRPETIIWHAGLANWTPYGQVAGAPAPGNVAVAAAPARAEAFCTECGRRLATEDLVRFGEHLVCGNCKEIFAQKLREGVALRGQAQYAGFWIRCAAILIDGVVLTGVYIVMSLLLGMMVPAFRPPQDTGGDITAIFPALMLMLVLVLLQVAFGVAYEVFFVVRFGATPGKMALRLKIVRADGSGIAVGRAFGRYFAKLLSGVVFYIGFIIAGFDAEKRALHDHICDTRVIKAHAAGL